LTGASSALVRLPRLAGLVDAAGARLLASAELLGTSGHRRIAHSLLAAASVTVVLPRLVKFVHASHVIAFGLSDWARASVTSHLSVLVTSASGASVLLLEGLTDLVRVAIISARARVVGAGDLAVGLAGASVAVLGDGLTDGQRHRAVFTVAWHRVVRARQLSVLHAGACVALISVELSSDIDGSAVVLASTGVVGTFNLSRGLAGARVAGILR